MKIAFLISNLSGGGSERVVATLANGFVKQDVETSIIVFSDMDRCYQIDKRVLVYSLEKYVGENGLGLKEFIPKVMRLRQIIKISKFDLVVVFMDRFVPYALLACLGTSCKVIGSERTNPYHYMWLLRQIVFGVAIACDGYVFQTNDARACFPEVVKKKSCVIGNPLVDKIYEWQGSLANTFCSVGRLHADKDYETLLQAVAIAIKDVPDLRLDIYGKGPLRCKLEQTKKRLGLGKNVCFKGFSNSVQKEITKYGAFVFSSKLEGLPNALLEAMASGMPCISSDCDFGPREIIKNGENGLLVPVGNIEEMAKALVILSNNKQLKIKIAKRAKEVKKTYDPEKVIKKFINYAKITCGK